MRTSRSRHGMRRLDEGGGLVDLMWMSVGVAYDSEWVELVRMKFE